MLFSMFHVRSFADRLVGSDILSATATALVSEQIK